MSFGRRNNFMDPDFDGRRGRGEPAASAAMSQRGGRLQAPYASNTGTLPGVRGPGRVGQPADGAARARRAQQAEGAPAAAAGPVNDNVPNGLLKTARQTGVLNLANRDLTHVPDKVWQVSSTTEAPPSDVSLDRGDNGPRWWEVEEIRKLLLSANRLVELSEGVGQLAHLSVVDLRDNQLSHLPAALCGLQELRSLNASKNRLVELPAGLAGCPELAQLCLSGNLLTHLPPDIGRLDCLAELDVADNRLAALPDSLVMLSGLRTLEAGGNRLECLPARLAELPLLARLGLAGNLLADLPAGPYPALEVLDAADNRLTEPPELSAPSKLKELRLSNNRVGRLGPDRLAALSSLRHLELRRNCLAELPADLPALLPQLERLDLTDNDLSSLPADLGLMEGLKCILVEGNPMRALRREVLAKGTEAVKKYLASRIATEASSPEAAAPSTPGEVAAPGGRTAAAADQQRREAPKSLSLLQEKLNLDLSEVRSTRALKYAGRGAAAANSDELWDLMADLQLARVDLASNALDGPPDRLTRPPFSDSLHDLSLRQNRIQDLDPGVGRLTGLSVLDLSVNQLSRLPRDLSSLACLTQLVLSGNRFEEVPEPVYALAKLETLLLGNNRVSRLDTDRLRSMESLGTLDLTNNCLGSVPPELGLCQRLRNLQLEGNPFRVPRPAQLARGSAFVLEYLRSRVEGGAD